MKKEELIMYSTNVLVQAILKTINSSLLIIRYSLRLQSRTFGAGSGNRTHVASLEGWNSTIELHPHVLPPDSYKL